MRISNKFGAPSVIHEGIHYFPKLFKVVTNGVQVEVVHKRHKWVQDTMKITLEFAIELKDYYDEHGVKNERV